MTTEEYIKLYKKYPWSDTNYTSKEEQEQDKQKIRDYNRALIEKYPWLEPTNRWSGKKIIACSKGEKGFWPTDPDALPEYDYDRTELDNLPEGWRIAFGDQLCEELNNELVRFNYQNEYMITEIKEKYGCLHWYSGGTPIGKLSEKPTEIVYKEDWDGYGWVNDNPKYKTKYVKYVEQTSDGKYKFEVYDILDKCKVRDIIRKYEDISMQVCIRCGKPAKWMTTNWVSYYCDDCKSELENKIYDKFKRIEEEK